MELKYNHALRAVVLYFVLIVPYGIEIKIQSLGYPCVYSINCTLWN